MHIKRFTSPTVREAMKLIKAEFGDQALILSTKRLSDGFYEVVAAVDYDLSQPVTLNIANGTYGKGGTNTSGPAGSTGGGKPGNDASFTAKAEDSDDLARTLRNELKELKELKDLCLSFASRSDSPFSAVFNRLEENMVGNGVDKRLVRKILMNTLSGVTKEKAADIIYLKSRIRSRVLEKIDVADPLAKRGVVAFVGPTGVGKTTTIAKLAAIHALKKKRKIALLAMDTYRIAAVEQLKVYGKLIGVPVEVAKDAGELSSCLGMHRDKDLILIDTAGASQRNRAQISELEKMAKVSPEIRFNLVLSSQSRDEALYDSVRGFSPLGIDSLTFTKLDEGSTYGPILNAMMLSKRPVAYLTSGQRVPEDIEAASKERLLNIFLPN